MEIGESIIPNRIPGEKQCPVDSPGLQPGSSLAETWVQPDNSLAETWFVNCYLGQYCTCFCPSEATVILNYTVWICREFWTSPKQLMWGFWCLCLWVIRGPLKRHKRAASVHHPHQRSSVIKTPLESDLEPTLIRTTQPLNLLVTTRGTLTVVICHHPLVIVKSWIANGETIIALIDLFTDCYCALQIIWIILS